MRARVRSIPSTPLRSSRYDRRSVLLRAHSRGLVAALAVTLSLAAGGCRRRHWIEHPEDDPWNRSWGSSSSYVRPPPHPIEGELLATPRVLLERTWTAEQWPLTEHASEHGYAMVYATRGQVVVGYAGYDEGADVRWLEVPVTTPWVPTVDLDALDIDRQGVVARVEVTAEQVHVFFAKERAFVGVVDRSTGGWLATRTFETPPSLHWARRSANGWHLIGGRIDAGSSGSARAGWLADAATDFPKLTALPHGAELSDVGARLVEDAQGRLLLVTWLEDEGGHRLGAFVADVEGEGTWTLLDVAVVPYDPPPPTFAGNGRWAWLGWSSAEHVLKVVGHERGVVTQTPAPERWAHNLLLSDGGQFLHPARTERVPRVEHEYRRRATDPLRFGERAQIPAVAYELATGEAEDVPAMPTSTGELTEWEPDARLDVGGRMCFWEGSAKGGDGNGVRTAGGSCYDPQAGQWQWVSSDLELYECVDVAYLSRGTVVRCGARQWVDDGGYCVRSTIGAGEHPWTVRLVEIADGAVAVLQPRRTTSHRATRTATTITSPTPTQPPI